MSLAIDKKFRVVYFFRFLRQLERIMHQTTKSAPAIAGCATAPANSTQIAPALSRNWRRTERAIFSRHGAAGKKDEALKLLPALHSASTRQLNLALFKPPDG